MYVTAIFPLFHFPFQRQKPYLTVFYDSMKANMNSFYRKEENNMRSSQPVAIVKFCAHCF